jgi:hypothetical protein
VIEALQERGRMLRNTPHLTSNQEFIIPVYRWLEVVIYYFGLKFYDILSGRLSLGKSYFLKKEKTLSRLPNIKKENLIGGVVYHDGQFDDSRMVLALARSCVENGGIVLNYFKVTGLLKNSDGKIKPELSAKVYIQRSKYDAAIVIPEETVTQTDIGPVVFVADGDIAKMRSIEIIARYENKVAVKSGLKEGDKLIKVGFQNLVDGTRITETN